MSVLLIAVLAAAGPTPAAVQDAVAAHLRSHDVAILREFAGLLAIPNLASDGPNIRANAERIAEMLARRGVAAHLLDGEGGPPVIYGELESPGAQRTIAVYAHYDSQPVDPARWTGQPWTPVLRDRPLEEGGVEIALGSRPAFPSP